MSERFFTLLILSLTLHDVLAVIEKQDKLDSTGFQVWTLLQNSYYDNKTVNIICRHNALKAWTVRASVSINGQKVCSTGQNDTACEGRSEENQFNFTLKISAEQKGLPCRCMVYRSDPLPVLTRAGGTITLYPGCDVSSRPRTNHETTNSMEESDDDPQSAVVGLLTWILLGIVLLLSVYSLIMTVVYIKLRVKVSEELKLTYVPMQINPGRFKKKAKGTDKNAEYMDMREVHQQVHPIRDMNHNARLNPVGGVI